MPRLWPSHLPMRIAAASALAAVSGVVSCPARADETPSAAAPAMRLLKTNCFSCHNEEKKKSGLVLTSRQALLKGGDNGVDVVSGAPEKSPFLDALAADADPHMPPKKQLPAADIEILSRWIADGAAWDAEALKAQPSAPRNVTLAALPSAYHPVLALGLSPNGSRLAVGCGNQVVLYDVTGKEPIVIARASAHPDPVQAIAWSADGNHLATGAFRRLVIWNADQLTSPRSLTDGLTDRLTALRFLPGGEQIVAADGRASETGTIRIVDAANLALTASWAAHADLIYDLALSPDGKLLATAGGDKLVKLWDMQTHTELAHLEGHVAQVLAVAFDAKADQLVSGGADQQLKVWDVKTKERTNTLGTHATSVNSAVWTPGKEAIFAVTDAGELDRYTELKAASGAQNGESSRETRFTSTGEALCCVTASADGEHVFAGSQAGRLIVWNKDGNIVAQLDVTAVQPLASTAP